MTVAAMPGAVPGTGRRHRVVAIGSGFGRLTATKALKRADITDALTFLTRISARGTAHVVNHTSLSLQVIPTTAAVLTAVGVLITLCVAIRRMYSAASASNVTKIPPQQAIPVVTDVCRLHGELGKVGADHAIHRIA